MGSSWALGPELVHQQSWPKALAQHLRPREPKNWLVSWRWTYLGLNFDTYSICLLKSRFEDGLDYPKLVGKTNLEQSCAETIKISQIPILCCLSVIAKRNCNSLGPDLLVNTPILLIVLPVPLYWRPQNKQIQFPNFLRSEAPTSAATEISSSNIQSQSCMTFHGYVSGLPKPFHVLIFSEVFVNCQKLDHDLQFLKQIETNPRN